MSSPSPAFTGRTVLSIPRAYMVALAVKYGPRLDMFLAGATGRDGKPLDGAHVLFAVSGRESAFGRNLAPRHEPAWDIGGSLWKNSAGLRTYIARYGPAGAMSYGPLQLMAFNAGAVEPDLLAADVDMAMQAAVEFMIARAFKHFGVLSLDALCNVWNAGNPNTPAPNGYADEVWHHYATEVVA